MSIGEPFAAGGGAQMRAAIWLAATTAAMLAGRSAVDYCLQVDLVGHIDGPSAGTILTAGQLAVMTRVSTRSDVSRRFPSAVSAVSPD